MLHNHSHFANYDRMPPRMTYVLKWMGEPVYATKQWIDMHRVALQSEMAFLVHGCIFTLVPGATIEHVRTH
jgi:hypothetical protein